ncbi:MAG TPA: hypothetical protein DEP19_03350 [Anaerolineae bacterium]|nr:hypothetical protein [Anaerolineae bacterium]HCK66042.1 hypothetical protein [Anaerolineae bacterium]
MRKILNSIVALIVLLALTTSTVFAGQALELIEVRNNSAGPTFIFRVSGEFTKEELNTGFVVVQGGDDYTLHCGQKHGDRITCHTTKKVGGHNVVIGFGNARFWTYVPLPNVCYSIWDWLVPPDPNAWTNFGTHCQERDANPGEIIQYYNQYSDAYESVMFFDIYTPLSGTCAVTGYPPTNEAGYYFPSCP